ncbi:type I-B CRISPR-associated endonuclease Cas1b [Thermoanaerobacterium thermosaccharolyticum]|uniref:CRISPR-associated endonuclease Cas1 n=1 Tax=Thermoanaerobacterium thermosaccharolyticum TaxID=1517 RepID=A0A231VMH7_THETR|nr:type I-B CRISPR-associated endonuclease Cas1b [Thermoanaerobacterium thermosaccharolyticum]OXT08896.1 subtype I-B CRISPR-associated endonuclease Cas1 [Thermoanaerobacterium thermosaccharolyticum]
MKKSIYVFNDGEFKRKDNTVFFESENGRKYLPVENINDIFVYSEINFNKKFIEFISQKEILIHFFNYYGYYTGTYYPREHYNSGYMILKQAEHYLDNSKRLKIALSFVMGAARNIQQVLRYYQNRNKDISDKYDLIDKLKEKISDCKNINELMGIEGNIRDYYYRSFNEIINNDSFKIEQRNKRPPQDPLNTLISFGNSLMYTVVLSEIYKTHLDPRIGYLHSTNFRKFTLNLDIAEIFKPIIIDRLIFSLIDKSMITEDDFSKTYEGLLLSEKAKKTFVASFDDKLKTTIKHRDVGKEVSYRMLIRMELYKLEKHLIEEQEYKPFIARW